MVYCSFHLLSRSALVVIDLQNEFFSPEGNFPVHEDCRATVIANLQTLIPQFRDKVGRIIWVKAIYEDRTEEPPAMKAQVKGTGAVSSNEWLVASTHVFEISCCKEGTFGVEMFPEVWKVHEEEDVVIAKGAYSSFSAVEQPTKFESLIRDREINNIYLCGTASGTCVLATAIDAVNKLPQVQVNVVIDCCGWRRENSHIEAIERYKALGVQIVDSKNVSEF